jgi:thioredoxin 2
MNRLPLEKLRSGAKPQCGRCQSALAVDHKPVSVTDASFSNEVERWPAPVLLDLWAPWCGPCRMVAPMLEMLAEEWAGRIRVAKVNVDENPQTASRFGAQSIPMLIVLKNGCEVDRMVGVQPKVEIERRLERIAG